MWANAPFGSEFGVVEDGDPPGWELVAFVQEVKNDHAFIQTSQEQKMRHHRGVDARRLDPGFHAGLCTVGGANGFALRPISGFRLSIELCL